MRIPSYDDLTPSIPDVSPLDVFASAQRLMPASPPVAVHDAIAPTASVATLFACVYTRESPPPGQDALTAIAAAFSPRFERYGDAAVVLDVSGLGRLLGTPQAIGAELERAARASGRRLHVAVAPTQTTAMLLAMARPTLTVVTADPAAAIAPLPLTFLEQLIVLTRPASDGPPDAGPRTPGSRRRTSDPGPRTPNSGPRLPDPGSRPFDTFRRWGLTTIGELAALPADDLSERLGTDGPALHRRARGIDPRPLVPDPDAPRFMQSLELEWPIDGLEPLSFVLARLLEPLSSSLERADRGAAAIRLDLRLTDRSTYARVLQLPAAMRDARVLRTLLLLDLESHPPPAAIDIVTIEIDPAPARIIQYSLLARARPSAETVATLMARVTALVGASRCGSPAILDTYRPDGFEMRPFVEHKKGAEGAEGAEGARAQGAGAQGAGARDGLGVVLRRFRPPVALRVATSAGRPAQIAIDRRGMPGGRVEQYSGPWRTSGGWWEGADRWDRDEWDVALSDGSLCRIVRDRLNGVWFMEGILD